MFVSIVIVAALVAAITSPNIAEAITREDAEARHDEYFGITPVSTGDVHISTPDDIFGEKHVVTGGGGTQQSAVDLFPEEEVGIRYRGLLPELRWEYETAGVVDSSPCVDPTTGWIYVGSQDYHLYAFTSEGELQWSFRTDGSIFISSPAVRDGVVYIGSRDHNVYALDAESGLLLWKYYAGDPFSSSANISPDGLTIYIGCEDGGLHAIDAHTGIAKWVFATGAEVESSPTSVTDSETGTTAVFVGSNDANVYAVEDAGSEGRLLWKFQARDMVQSSPVVGEDGTVYIGSHDHRLYAIDPTGTKKWEFNSGFQIISSPFVDDDRHAVYFGSNNHIFYSLDARTGDLNWKFRTRSYLFSSPTACSCGGIVFVGGYDHQLYAFNADHGYMMWSMELGGAIASSPVLSSDERTLYVGSGGIMSYDTHLYAIDVPMDDMLQSVARTSTSVNTSAGGVGSWLKARFESGSGSLMIAAIGCVAGLASFQMAKWVDKRRGHRDDGLAKHFREVAEHQREMECLVGDDYLVADEQDDV